MTGFSRVHLCNQGCGERFCRLSPAAVADVLKCPVSFGFIGMALPIALPVAGRVADPFLMAQFLLGPVIGIGFDLVSLPGRLSATLTGGLRAIVLFPVSGNEKRAAVNTRDLLHMVAPVKRDE